MATALFSSPPFTTSPLKKATPSHHSFHGLRPLKPTDSPSVSNLAAVAASPCCRPKRGRRAMGIARAELSAPLVISLSTGLSLFLGRFVFFNFQRENVAKQGPGKQNGVSHFEAGDVRAKEYSSLLKSNDPVGFNVVDVLAWGSIGHIVAYYILATASNGYDPKFFE
uniref:Photosystem I reaction center subunit V, chloroplastic n=1 Tax=Anthurium amnicola TaxID=1678845 RepID=A0A1D1ZJ85_9ARAE